MTIENKISLELGISEEKVNVVLELLKENTIPFIARYRKEVTGGLDEVEIKGIEDKFDYLSKLEHRKEFILEKIDEKGKLTKSLKDKINKCDSLQDLEDIYLPFKEKKSSKAEKAIEKGLDKVAEKIKSGKVSPVDINRVLSNELKRNDKVDNEEEVIEGVKEILKADIIETLEVRENVKTIYDKNGVLKVSVTKNGKELDKDEKFTMYYDYEEKLNKIPSHRWLAIQRGVNEKILRVTYLLDKENVHKTIGESWVINSDSSKDLLESDFIQDVIKDSYSKSLKGSLERNINSNKNEVFGNESIKVFADNLENLLLKQPLKDKVILTLDPAYRTGCKIAIVGKQGESLGTGVIYPHKPQSRVEESKLVLDNLVNEFDVDVIAIGNGTASRETEELVRGFIKETDRENSLVYYIVDESGASVYSASEVARREFPNLSVEKRSAISIGRRLQDPLAELVKIDPRSIGVGQYQHDINQTELKKALDFTVEKIVNRVGVDVNTASIELLSYVAGLNSKIAKNIVDYRNENGRFNKRSELKKVKGVGPKAFEQSIGFLRIYGGSNKLDATGIHPDNYKEAKDLLKRMGKKETDLGDSKFISFIENVLERAEGTNTNMYSELELDILNEFSSFGNDVRNEVGEKLRESVMLDIEDLSVGSKLNGVVRNVVDFGAFIDIGLKNDGLVHISKLSKEFVKNPRDVVKVGDEVVVWIESIDKDKGKVSLRMVN